MTQGSASLEHTVVWRKITPSLRDEIVRFWVSNRLLPAGVSPEERAAEVTVVVRETTGGAIVGLSSAGHIQFKQLNNNYFFAFRMAVLPEYRVPGLVEQIAVTTRDVLEAYSATMSDYPCIGMITFVENQGVIAARREAVWPATGMVYIGNDPSGRQIRVYYFKGATI